jgi:predicted RNA-binding protein YlxR (DUF448 family)
MAKQPADGGSDAGVRRCIVTGTSSSREGLIRFVVDPNGTLVPDLGEDLPGRGIWVSAERVVLEKACERGLFARAARRPIVVPVDLLEQVERQMTARLLNLLGLARRAGALVAGFEKVREALKTGRVAVLIEARDGARHGRARLAGLAGNTPVINQLDGAALSKSLGRDIVVHAALAPGRLADRVLRESERLAGVRPTPSATARPDDGAAH